MEDSKVLTINTEDGMVSKAPSPQLLPIFKDLPALKHPSQPFNFDEPQMNPVDLARQLTYTMKHYGGIGLAAVQCNIPLRVFAIDCDVVCFNPTIDSTSKETNRHKEGCLSFPGIFLPIPRANTVTISWHDEHRQPHTQTFSGLTARAILHEYDHLEGKIFTELVGSLTLQMAKKKKKKMFKKLERIAEIQRRMELTQPIMRDKKQDKKILKINTDIGGTVINGPQRTRTGA